MDFLSQFDKNNYIKDPVTPKTIKTEEIVTVQKTQAVQFESSPPSVSSVPDAAIQGPVHQTVVDKSFQMKKLLKYGIIAVSIIAVCVTGIVIFRLTNRIEVKSLTGNNVNDARNWALRNRIELDVTEAFDLQYDKDTVIVQHPESGKIQRGSILEISVSKGPDPDEVIAIPDFTDIKNAAEVRNWITANKASNARVIQEYSDEIEDGKFIRLEFRSDLVNESNYTRKDTLNIYVSRGVEPVNQNITVPNFRNQTKEDAEKWAETNKIRLIFTESDSEEIDKGRIISQDTEPRTRVAEEHEITVTVSLGKGVTVPDFNTISKNEAASRTDLNVEVVLKYSATAPYGQVISQSVPAGTKMFGDDKKVRVVYSEGRPFIEDLIGRSESTLPAYFYELRFKGANITYNTAYVDSSAPRGTVVAASHSSQFVEMTLAVQVQISLGNLQPTEPSFPDFNPEPPGNDTPSDNDKPPR